VFLSLQEWSRLYEFLWFWQNYRRWFWPDFARFTWTLYPCFNTALCNAPLCWLHYPRDLRTPMKMFCRIPAFDGLTVTALRSKLRVNWALFDHTGGLHFGIMLRGSTYRRSRLACSAPEGLEDYMIKVSSALSVQAIGLDPSFEMNPYSLRYVSS